MLVRQVAFHARELQIGFIVLVGDPYAALVFDVAVGHWVVVDMPRVAGKSEFFPAVIAIAVGAFEHSLLQRLGPFLSRHHSSVVGFFGAKREFSHGSAKRTPTLAPPLEGKT